LGDDCARLVRELLERHPYAPAWPADEHHSPDPVYAADLYARLREDVAERDAKLAAFRQRIAGLEAANLSLEQLVDAYRPSLRTPYVLTEAGEAATGGTVAACDVDTDNVTPLPVAAR
jgi:hypothetical protein